MRYTAVDEEYPVLIVGGGGAGLTASMLLTRLGVDHLLVSARPETSDLPKAHVLNQRAMEVLDDVGVADAIARRSTPADQMAATAFYAGFAGPESDYGRRLARIFEPEVTALQWCEPCHTGRRRRTRTTSP